MTFAGLEICGAGRTIFFKYNYSDVIYLFKIYLFWLTHGACRILVP